MEDIPFAILHYLILNEYQFRQCEHCEKYFATKTLKQKYCMRKSPYKGCAHLECGEAVDHLMKKIKKRKKSIMTNLGNYYPEASDKFWCEFNKYSVIDGKNVWKSWRILETLEQITSKEYVKAKWYKPEYK
jgi:hypothetical protein